MMHPLTIKLLKTQGNFSNPTFVYEILQRNQVFPSKTEDLLQVNLQNFGCPTTSTMQSPNFLLAHGWIEIPRG